MKSELKLEFNNNDVLNNLIQKSYFEEGQMGRLSGKKNFIEVTPDLDDILHTILKDLNNATVKISNPDLIDGSCRFIVSERNNEIKIKPISIFCIKDETGRYSFY
jgi:hypothetical protein